MKLFRFRPTPRLTRVFTLALTLAAFTALAESPAASNPSPAVTQPPVKAPELTPQFHTALRQGTLEALRAALDQGASAVARDAQGNTPLMLAALYGNVATVRLLLDRGAEVTATNVAGATALHRAAHDPDLVALLLERGAPADARAANGNSPLLLAARGANSHRAVQLLLSRGAEANAANVFGATPLMAAAAGGDTRTVRLLVRHGANPNARPNLDHPGFLFGGGRSPLMWAAFRGDLATLQVLLDAGADVNLPGLIGTALAQATWSDQTDAARLLLAKGAQVQISGFVDGYLPLHWAASSEHGNPELVNLLLAHGADANRGGGEAVDAFLGTPQTPLMLARRRGTTPIVEALRAAGATNETPDRPRPVEFRARSLPATLEASLLREAVSDAVAPLQATALASKANFLKHGSRQDCTSCHQQHLPMTAVGLARRFDAKVNLADQDALIGVVQAGEIKDPEIDWQPLFHPDPVMTKGYELLAYASEQLPADANADAWVHHLASIQGRDGQWHNNLPRPPIQTGDIGATALAIHALTHYPLPGRAAEMNDRVRRARLWLAKAKAEDTDSRAYQLLGLAWAGESAKALEPFAAALLAEQRADGGWAQLPGLTADAYATGQAIYALRVATARSRTDTAVERGLRFLLGTQLTDGTWYVRRRAFPFQPTMDSGFPHGRDGWISAAATSWAVMALSLPEDLNRSAAQAAAR